MSKTIVARTMLKIIFRRIGKSDIVAAGAYIDALSSEEKDALKAEAVAQMVDA